MHTFTPRLDQLREPSSYPGRPPGVKISQTHIPIVCVAGDWQNFDFLGLGHEQWGSFALWNPHAQQERKAWDVPRTMVRGADLSLCGVSGQTIFSPCPADDEEVDDCDECQSEGEEHNEGDTAHRPIDGWNDKPGGE